MVTCESWSNLPLNEAFATYGEYLWMEHKYGRTEADMPGFQDMIHYLHDPGEYGKLLIRYKVPDREEMFDVVTYQKVGRVLKMLRKYVGDDTFFSALRQYMERHRFKPGDVNGWLQAFMEETGQV